MAQKDVRSFVIPLGRSLAEQMGFEWIDAELVKEGPGRYLRIYLDIEGGITLDDCERFHRTIQPKLEDVDYDFLEVSSPGIDRPLKTERDYEKALGTEVEVKLYRALSGRKAYTGTLSGYDEDALVLDTPSEGMTIARKDIALVRPVVHFEEDDEDEGDGNT